MTKEELMEVKLRETAQVLLSSIIEQSEELEILLLRQKRKNIIHFEYIGALVKVEEELFCICSKVLKLPPLLQAMVKDEYD